MREAPSLVLAGRLLSEGAEVTAWDPVADGRSQLHGVEVAESALEALTGADAAVIVTEWPEVSELDWAAAGERMRGRVVIDGRNVLDPEEMRALGFAYEGIGRPRMTPAGGHPRGRAGHEAPTAHRPGAQGHAPARRPAAPRVHLRAPRAPRRRALDHLVRLPPRPDRVDVRRQPRRDVAGLRGRGRAARNGRRDRLRRRASSKGASSRSTATRSAKPTSARWSRSIARPAPRRRSCSHRSRTRAGTGSSAPPPTVASSPSSRSRGPRRSTPTSSTPGSTSSSRRCSSSCPPERRVSIEREVFPTLAAEGSVYGIALPGYWLDVGTPESYLQAHRDVLERIFETAVGDALGADFTLVDETADVHADAKLVPPVYVGPGAVVERGARLGSLAVLGAGARLAEGGIVENAVVGARTSVGAGASVVGFDRRRRGRARRGERAPQPLGRRAWGARGERERARPRAARRRRAAHPRRGAALLVNPLRDASPARSRSRGAGSSSGPRLRTTSASSSSSARASR